MGFSKFRRARDAAEVDLIPVMNLFVVMIPFLLLSAAFLHVGVIPTTVPTRSEGSSDVAANELAVTINVVLAAEELRLSASHATLDPEVLAELATTIPRDGEFHDLEAFSQVLAGIKRQYPESDTMILLPDTGVVYKDVVTVLDASRELVIDEGTPTERRVALFPVAVLSKRET